MAEADAAGFQAHFHASVPGLAATLSVQAPTPAIPDPIQPIHVAVNRRLPPSGGWGHPRTTTCPSPMRR